MAEKNKDRFTALEEAGLEQVSGGKKNDGYRCPKCGSMDLRKGAMTMTCCRCRYSSGFDSFYCSNLDATYTIENPDGTVTTSGTW